MTDRKKHEAPTASREFSEMWNHALSKNRPRSNKSRNKTKHTQLSPCVNSSSPPKVLETPRCRGRLGYSNLNSGDSPGDGEMVHDIIWDSTSPSGNNGKGPGETRVVKISDIVNRIAPKDTKPTSVESALLQWIGDSAVPCTPEARPPSVKRKSTRQSNVEDLMKLAKQFDISMHQQDKESLEQRNNTLNNLSKHNTAAGRSSGEIIPAVCVEERGSLSSRSQQAEDELHALFDGPTQRISGRLSQGSSASSYSQDIKGQPGVCHLATHRSEVKSGPVPCDVDGIFKGASVKADDFDDDWENDDLLNDSNVLEMNSEPQAEVPPKPSSQTCTIKNYLATESLPAISTCRSTRLHCPDQVSIVHPQASRSNLTGLCPKPKTTNRSTFKLDPNPYFQGKMSATREVPKTCLTLVKPQPTTQRLDRGCPTATPGSSFAVTSDQRTENSLKDVSDVDFKSLFDSESQWDEGDDDELLYQVCDNVERISYSQPESVTSSDGRKQLDDIKRKMSTPVIIDIDRSVNRGSCSYVRSNSAPGTSIPTENFQLWNVPYQAANHSIVTQSHSGGRVGMFTQATSAPGGGSISHGTCATFQSVDNKTTMQPHTVSARNPNSHHASFKRHLSDSATMNNKVFVTSGMAGKCSALEIERKKQEAIARRRTRMQTHNPGGASC
ncbi:ewing's tumor-associated antigen 1 homolog [Osmerus mordax]|uniref:ewing's tumor-associated antigen 1 homolog n=1 Tax=Osmerus mordax TaxID=8014 RepID=UPI003510A25A